MPGHEGHGRQQAALEGDGRVVLAGVEPGVVDRQAGAGRQVGGQVEVALGVATAVGQLGAERERPEHLPAGAQRHDDRRPGTEQLVLPQELGSTGDALGAHRQLGQQGGRPGLQRLAHRVAPVLGGRQPAPERMHGVGLGVVAVIDRHPAGWS